MMIEVDIIDETHTLTMEQLRLVENVLHHAGEAELLERPSELSVTFVHEEAIKELNRDHRGIDKATDVLSFALNDGEEEGSFDILPEGMPNMLGDIIVSVGHIKSQAHDYGHSFERELAFLVVHGFLHLLGYDHMNENDEKQMFTKQEEILQSYGIGRSKS
ncbi:rRNA maturation RNase YbeY [Shouchella patagoniensis]|uniref:rRNA maturation RNase YbeY n=1 Tax=Shouchella patagoniensis TaxID=228576 RepID=UPI0015D605BC|nr:rRNA maturation RNase YbeY [Shouchella patagoniensis]